MSARPVPMTSVLPSVRNEVCPSTWTEMEVGSAPGLTRNSYFNPAPVIR